MSTCTLPTDANGDYYAGPQTAAGAAFHVLNDAGTYATAQELLVSRDNHASLLRTHGFTRAAKRLEQATSRHQLMALAYEEANE